MSRRAELIAEALSIAFLPAGLACPPVGGALPYAAVSRLGQLAGEVVEHGLGDVA
jgi:hypothetical protein